MKRGDAPKNRLDAAAMQHDIAYSRENTSLYQKHSADLQMANTIGSFKNRSLLEKAVSIGLRFKVLLGLKNSTWPT